MTGDLQAADHYIRSLLGRHSNIVIRLDIDMINHDGQHNDCVVLLTRLCGCITDLDSTLAELLATGEMKALELKVIGSKLQESEVIHHVRDIFQSSSLHPRCFISAPTEAIEDVV